MILIVATTHDPASLNIRSHLLSSPGWSRVGEFDGNELHSSGENLLALCGKPHLENDGLDRRWMEETGKRPDALLFLSKHRSVSNARSLTVHPIGNFAKAEFGGREGTLVPSAPRLMSGLLHELAGVVSERGLPFSISFEATHHGPLLETPTAFIEIGSDGAAWDDPEAGKAVADAIHCALRIPQSATPVAVGVGGGHYAPRITDVALGGLLDFGHIVPSYAVEGVALETVERYAGMALAATPGAKAAYFHRKALPKPLVRHLTAWFEARGIEVVRSSKAE